MASAADTRLGGRAFNHSQSSSAEAEYDRLRDLARQEHGKAQSCFDRAHQAYSSGNGAEASSLSSLGKEHQAKATDYNRQASEFIFRENNADSRVPADTIDLHGQYVEEAEQILETRIKAALASGQTHLHVIVGKGNHSPGHIQKIKPMVERICQEEGLQYNTEPNAGRIYVNLQGGPANMPPEHEWAQGYSGGGYGGYGQQQGQLYQGQGQTPHQQQAWQQEGAGYQYQPHPQGQPQYGQQQQHGQQQQQQQTEQMQLEQAEQNLLRSCLKSCCTVM